MLTSDEDGTKTLHVSADEGRMEILAYHHQDTQREDFVRLRIDEYGRPNVSVYIPVAAASELAASVHALCRHIVAPSLETLRQKGVI